MKDPFLDHDHSSFADYWTWGRRMTLDQRNLDYFKDTVRKIINGPTSQGD